jgi:DHA1 family multidrug resistance protein-like MFS transporter
MKKAKIYLLFISLMFGILFSLGNPAIPVYTAQLGIKEGVVGFYLASGGLGLLVFATLWGALGDIKDRNKVLGIIFIGAALGQIIFGITSNQYIMLVGAMITGIFTAGVLVNIYSYVNDSFKDEQERNRMLSYVVSLYLLGFAIAYILGGYLTVFVSPNYYMVFIIQGLLLFSFGGFIYFEKTDLIDIDHHLTRRHFWINIQQVRRFPWVPIYTITLTFFISFSHNNVRRFLDYYIIDEGFNAITLGTLVFVVGLFGLVSNVWIAPYFMKRYHNFRFLQAQFLFAPIFLFLAFYIEDTLMGMYTFYIGYSIMLAIYEPTAISFMSSNRAVSQGVLVGVRQSVVGLGMTLGFITGGFLYQENNLYVFYLAILFYIIVFIGFTVLVFIKRKEVKEYRLDYLKEKKV